MQYGILFLHPGQRSSNSGRRNLQNGHGVVVSSISDVSGLLWGGITRHFKQRFSSHVMWTAEKRHTWNTGNVKRTFLFLDSGTRETYKLAIGPHSSSRRQESSWDWSDCSVTWVIWASWSWGHMEWQKTWVGPAVLSSCAIGVVSVFPPL